MTKTMTDPSLTELLALGRAIWGPPPTGTDTTNRLPAVLSRLQVGIGDIARIAREYGSCHWQWVHGERDIRAEARQELSKEMGNIILSTIRWCDDLGLNVLECVQLAEESQRAYASSNKKR